MLGIGNSGRDSWTNPIWEQIRDRLDLVDGGFAYSATRFNLSSTAQTDYVDGFWASGRISMSLASPPSSAGHLLKPTTVAEVGRTVQSR